MMVAMQYARILVKLDRYIEAALHNGLIEATLC